MLNLCAFVNLFVSLLQEISRCYQLNKDSRIYHGPFVDSVGLFVFFSALPGIVTMLLKTMFMVMSVSKVTVGIHPVRLPWIQQCLHLRAAV